MEDEGEETVDATTAFFRSWAWKREHRPDRDRFKRPYKHEMQLESYALSEGEASPSCTLTIQQAKFGPEGFASTVWDSSIVMAKFLERHAGRYRGKRCLDLSAGCGLVAIALAKLGARVTATDLVPNLPLLASNCEANVPGQVTVLPHMWGDDVQPLQAPMDVVVACDVMYVREQVGALMQSLAALSDEHTEVLVAHGRNRFAETDFFALATAVFDVVEVAQGELHKVYRCSDVTVWRLRKKLVLGDHSG